MRCFYFESHVLPADPALEAAYFNRDTTEAEKKFGYCANCGTAFKRKSNRQKYCSPCAAIEREKQKKAARLRYKRKAL